MEASTPVLSEAQRVEVRRRPHRFGIPLFGLAAWLRAVLIVIFGIAQAQAADAPASVDSQRMISADRDTANWLSYGRTYSEQRFSPLAKINADNAKQLGLAWYADLDTNRGQQATP